MTSHYSCLAGSERGVVYFYSVLRNYDLLELGETRFGNGEQAHEGEELVMMPPDELGLEGIAAIGGRIRLQRLPVPLYVPPHMERAEMIQSIQVHNDLLFCGCEGHGILLY